MERKGQVVRENGACSKLRASYLSKNICEEQEKRIKVGEVISVECHTRKSKHSPDGDKVILTYFK